MAKESSGAMTPLRLCAAMFLLAAAIAPAILVGMHASPAPASRQAAASAVAPGSPARDSRPKRTPWEGDPKPLEPVAKPAPADPAR